MAVYKTMKGTQIDVNKLINQNEMAVAVGNMKVNARGDKLGPGGQIIQRKEEHLVQPQGGVPSQINVRNQTEDEDPTGGV